MRFLEKLNQPKFFSLGLVFLIIALLVYYKILNNFFASDDFHWLIISRDTILNWKIFTTNYEGSHLGGSYNPFLVIIFKLFYSIFHNNYFGYHFVSILIHSINATLLAVLIRKAFKISDGYKYTLLPFIAALIFLIYPVQVETISWISAWPHLWVTLFYLLSLINYFIFRQEYKNINLLYSFIFFILALLTKEIAISLPLVILIWEVYFYSKQNRNKWFIYYLPAYFVILCLFLWLRYLSTGLVFGYYASNAIKFSLVDFVANILPFLADFFTFGFLRNFIYRGLYHYSDLVAIIVMTGLALYFFILLRKKAYKQFVIISSLLFVLAPVLVTGLHKTTFAGERYLYLPSVFFIILIVHLLNRYNTTQYKKFLPIIMIVFLTVVIYKINIWKQASNLSQQIVKSYGHLDIETGKDLLAVALPDNLDGAEVFRNNLGQALEIYYPDSYPNIIYTQAYLQVSKDNFNEKLLKWRQDDRGWFGESTDGGFVVTGITSISNEGMYWELWNYNYQNYKANIIRLIPNYITMEKIKNDQIDILIFDQGKLYILE